MSKVRSEPSDCKVNENGRSFIKNHADFHPISDGAKKEPGSYNLSGVIDENLSAESVDSKKVIEIAQKLGLRNYENMETSDIARELGIYDLYIAQPHVQ